jgi:hypothetical protein
MPYSALVFKDTESAARHLNIEVQSLEARTPDDMNSALEDAVRKEANALITVEDPLTQNQRKNIADFAAINQLPAMSGLEDYTSPFPRTCPLSPTM